MTDCETGLAVRRLVIPVDSLAPHARAGIFDWPALLGMREIATLTSPREAAAILASLLGTGPTAVEIAELVVHEPIIGFSDLTLATLADGSPERQLRLAQFAAEPLMMGVCPAALVVCGPAESLSKALLRSLSGK